MPTTSLLEMPLGQVLATANPTSESSLRPQNKRRKNKNFYIDELRTLHKEMIRYDNQITDYEPHTWRDQQPAYLKLVESLMTMQNKFKVMKEGVGFDVTKGENGFDRHYGHLKHREKDDAVGAVRKAEKWLKEVKNIFLAMKIVDKGRNAGPFENLAGLI